MQSGTRESWERSTVREDPDSRWKRSVTDGYGVFIVYLAAIVFLYGVDWYQGGHPRLTPVTAAILAFGFVFCIPSYRDRALILRATERYRARPIGDGWVLHVNALALWPLKLMVAGTIMANVQSGSLFQSMAYLTINIFLFTKLDRYVEICLAYGLESSSRPLSPKQWLALEAPFVAAFLAGLVWGVPHLFPGQSPHPWPVVDPEGATLLYLAAVSLVGIAIYTPLRDRFRDRLAREAIESGPA